jgi:hypothetical protein
LQFAAIPDWVGAGGPVTAVVPEEVAVVETLDAVDVGATDDMKEEF